MSILVQFVNASASRIHRGGKPSSEMRRPLINSIQMQDGYVNAIGVGGQHKLELPSSLREDADELKELSLPDGPRESFDENIFPEAPGVKTQKIRTQYIPT